MALKGNAPSFLRFWELGRRKTIDAAKICGGAENVVKTETQQTFVNGLLGFITLGIYTRWKRVCIAHNNCMSCPSIYTYLHCSLLYLPFQLFLHSDQPLSEGEIIPFSGVCQSGGGRIIHAGVWWLHALTDRLLWCATGRRPAATSSTRASFSRASANSFVAFLNERSITPTYLHVSNCRVRQFVWHFCRRPVL